MTEQTFEGWMALDKETGVGGMKWQQFQPKNFGDADVDIKITHCGVCGTDLHSLRSGLFPTDYPCCAGHEIVGVIERVGSKVANGLKAGMVAGVGPQIGSCAECDACKAGKQNYCFKMVQTYNSRYPDGTKTYGGFANYWRGPSEWVFPIPSGLKPAEAAPMLCGGITTYAPLKRFGCGPGKRVGVVGLGGLGHFAVLFAKAMGAEKVLAVSRSGAKKADAMRLGATNFVSTEEDNDWAEKHAGSLDIVLNTVASPEVPLTQYLSLLRPEGAFVQVGFPNLPAPSTPLFYLQGLTISGGLIGPPALIREMLDFAVTHNIHPMVEEKPMKEANDVVKHLEKDSARYRFVLVN